MKTIRKIKKSSSHCFARLRVAAYCRVSTDQYEQLESLETCKSQLKNVDFRQSQNAV